MSSLINEITNNFKKYKLEKSNESMEKFCIPKKYTLQPQQLFLSELLTSKYSPWNNYNNIRGILLYHNIGSGKTCTSIRIAEQFKKKLNIIIILPASLIGNYLLELRSECTNFNNSKQNEYISDAEIKKLKKLKYTDPEYLNIINKVNNRISKYYTIYSYNKFILLIKENKIINLNNTLLIIDEVQNMISLDGTYYSLLKKVIDKSDKTLKIVLLSATPIFDKPIEIALTLNLLKINDLFSINDFNQDFIKINNNNYKIINKNIFNNKIKNLISYYRGAPPQAYPKFTIKTIKCNMSNFQYKSYLTTMSKDNKYLKGSFKSLDILKMSQSFFLGPRMISNIAFPNKLTGIEGYKSLKGDVLMIKNICKYSIKFYKIIQKINHSEGPVFIYSNFKDIGGIKSFIKFLEYHKWKNYVNYNEGNKRFAIWSGDESLELKEQIKSIYNDKRNKNGNLIKIILGSPSIKEGISLLRVSQVHILEPYWNMSRILQIMGRAIRYCSHKDVPIKRRFVEVYIYLATYPNIKTIDKYIWSLAKKKKKLIQEFELLLKQSAIDCKLFYNRNNYDTDEVQLKCSN